MSGGTRELVYVALGSNLGDRPAHLAAARARLAALPDTALLAESSIEETAPLEALAQPPYLNQMVLLETGLTPHALRRTCITRWTAAGIPRDVVMAASGHKPSSVHDGYIEFSDE